MGFFHCTNDAVNILSNRICYFFGDRTIMHSSLSEFLKFYLTTNNYIWQHFPQMTLLWIPLEFFCYHVRHCNRSEGGKNCTKHALHVKGHLWSFNVRLKMSSEKKVQRPLCLLAAFFTKRKWLPGQRHSNLSLVFEGSQFEGE